MIPLPDNKKDLKDALDRGILVERHTLDFKSALPAGRGENKELARDLAQFAIDGGVLVLGVNDNDKTIPPKLTPVDLDGLKERIDQVAGSIPDPPMHVRITSIPTCGNLAAGYLLVTVPPTPYEPRQVDGRYYGRGDTTRRTLSAAEVERCYQLALRIQHDANALLDEAVNQGPFAGRGKHAHLFGIAQPVTPRSDLLLKALGPTAEAWQEFLVGSIRGSSQDLWSPDLPEACDPYRRAQGWALSTMHMSPEPDTLEQIVEDMKAPALYLEVREDGGLRLFCGRASKVHPQRSPYGPTQSVLDIVILGLTKRLVMAAMAVTEATDYLGSWDFGIAVTGIQGFISDTLIVHPDPEVGMLAARFSEHDYLQTTRATHQHLTQDPGAIVEELTGRLQRALGVSVEIPI